MYRLRSSVTVIPIAVAAIASGCGSGSSGGTTVSQQAWHTGVCKAVSQFSKDSGPAWVTFQGLSLQFQYGLPKQSDTRTKEVQATAKLAAAGTRFRQAIEAAGIPAIDQGAAYDRAVISALRDFEGDLNRLHDRASALPPGTGGASKDALLTPDVEASLTHLGEKLKAARTRYDVHMDKCAANS